MMKTRNWRKHLHSGDEVTWNDPDDGLCTRTGKISAIEYLPENTASIIWMDGSLTEVYLSELS